MNRWCPAPDGLGLTNVIDRRGEGVTIILKESEQLSGRGPEYSLIDDNELRLMIWAAT